MRWSSSRPPVAASRSRATSAGQRERALSRPWSFCTPVSACRTSERRSAQRIAAWGYVALFVDDFATRGLKETCAVDFKPALPDAYGALAYLASQPFVDPARIAAVGFSQGGDTALKIAAGAGGAGQGAAFKAAAAFYAPCANLADGALDIPTLILVGAKDEVHSRRGLR